MVSLQYENANVYSTIDFQRSTLDNMDSLVFCVAYDVSCVLIKSSPTRKNNSKDRII